MEHIKIPLLSRGGVARSAGVVLVKLHQKTCQTDTTLSAPKALKP